MLMVTLAVEDRDGVPISEAITTNSITPSSAGSIASRSNRPLFLSKPVSWSMVKLLLNGLSSMRYWILLFSVPGSSPSLAYQKIKNRSSIRDVDTSVTFIYLAHTFIQSNSQ